MEIRQVLSTIVGFILFWLLIILDLFPIGLPSCLRSMIIFLPFLAVISFGFYSLFYLIYKIWNLKDRPDAQLDLQREIEEIKRDPRYASLFRQNSTR